MVKESFRGWRAVSSPTHWSWKEERHFLEEKQGGELVVLFPPAAMAGQALASLFVPAMRIMNTQRVKKQLYRMTG